MISSKTAMTRGIETREKREIALTPFPHIKNAEIANKTGKIKLFSERRKTGFKRVLSAESIHEETTTFDTDISTDKTRSVPFPSLGSIRKKMNKEKNRKAAYKPPTEKSEPKNAFISFPEIKPAPTMLPNTVRTAERKTKRRFNII
ncbi:MAG TPA: hypothetical protein DDW54_01120 [Clostridiales bacterium]|nr:hypothetical protein [Clostridiales bacterium]